MIVSPELVTALAGISINAFGYQNGDFDPTNQLRAIDWAKQIGASAITVGWQIPINPVTGQIEDSVTLADGTQLFQKGALEDVFRLVQAAIDQGLNVTLKPYFVASNDPINFGSGPGLSDSSAKAGLATMATYLESFAAKAEDAGVSSIILGTENQALEAPAYKAEWEDLISHIRGAFNGLLGYATTYFPFLPDYNLSSLMTSSFGADLDFIGADLYVPVSATSPVTYAQAYQAWFDNKQDYWPEAFRSDQSPASLNLVAELEKLGATYEKSVLLTETGYLDVERTASIGPSGKNAADIPSLDQQEIVTQAMLDALSTADDTFAGIVWYSARPADFADGYDPLSPGNFGWSPVGTPAGDVLGTFLRHLQAPILGTASNDTLQYKTGDHVINGGAGLDRLVVTASHTEFETEQSYGKLLLSSGADISVVSGVERISFNDGTLAFDVNGDAGQAYRLYQAAFDRRPDTEGLTYWIKQLDTGGPSLNAVADSFIHSPEFQRLYGTPGTVSNGAYVDLLYTHTLGRDYDQSGYNYWVDKLDHDETNRGDLLAFFSESDENQARTASAVSDGIWLAA